MAGEVTHTLVLENAPSIIAKVLAAAAAVTGALVHADPEEVQYWHRKRYTPMYSQTPPA
jgi:hypothetical protein